MTSQPRLLINGVWIDQTAQRFPVKDPFTGELLAEVPLGDWPLLNQALAAAHDAFPAARQRSRAARAELLLALAAGVKARTAYFVETIVAEAGKPVTFAEAEVARAVMTFTTAAEEARRESGELLPLDALAPGQGHFGLAQRFPLGVVAAITPFNFPLNLVAHKVAPCLASGNTMVVKPALKTPLTALLLAEVLVEAGVPAGEVNFVTCENELVERFITDARVKVVSFTGSDTVGWQLKSKCVRKRVTLELGGNAAVIVQADADWVRAVPMIASGAFGAAGQSCISVQRLLVHAPIYDAFREALRAHTVAHIPAGDPRDRATVVGPLITREALTKAQAHLASALAAGATLVHGGATHGPCLEPTILENVPHSHPLWSEEAFAPIVALERYDDFEAALSLVNASRFGLQAAVFTRDLARSLRAYSVLEVGGVLINQVPTWRVENMPYGGVKDSGFGREGLRYAMEEMTELRSLIIHRED
jgi:acyl-CoA reductase-like NAD-dependent aldehyde dehydrogenase